MRTKMVAVLISSLGCVALLGCNTEAGYREGDAARPESQMSDTQQDAQRYDTQKQADTGAAATTGSLGSFTEWDADASGDVTKTEFDSRFASTSAWSDWDKNSDQALDQSEAANVKWFEGKDLEEWDKDADGKLARNEAGDALWRMLDGNADHKLEPGEWKA
jgi:hypothetical protein